MNFDALYAEHLEFVQRYIRKRIDDAAEVDDIAQEVFLRLAIRLRAGVDERWHTQKWLCRVAHNLCIDHWRHLAVRAGGQSLDDELLSPELRLLESPHGNPEPEHEASRIRALIGRAGADLSNTDLTLLGLRELQGLSYKQLAERLQKSDSAVETALWRARKNFAKRYRALEASA